VSVRNALRPVAIRLEPQALPARGSPGRGRTHPDPTRESGL